jgi:hypothetical protein
MVLTVLRVLVLLVPFAQGTDERVISGRVVDAAGKPVGGTIVVVTGASLLRFSSTGKYAPPQVLTASDGRFVFRNLSDGSFDVTATKNGYAEGAYGRRRPSGSTKSVQLTAAQPSAEITVTIWKNGSIAGTVTDEAGEPVVNAQLRLCKATLVGGARRFFSAGQTAMTDDRGAYRFGNLLPGDYLVAVSASRPSVNGSTLASMTNPSRAGPFTNALPGLPTAVSVADSTYGLGRGSIVPPPVTAGHLMVYPPTFYPSARSVSEAAVITVASGEERSAIDIQVQPAATGRVAGVLVGSDGPEASAQVRLEATALDGAQLGEGGGEDDLITLTDSAGRFVFSAVPFGDYRLLAGSGSATREWTNTAISVTSDVDPLVVTMRPPIKIAARYVYEGDPGMADRTADATSQSSFRPAPFLLVPLDGSKPFLPRLSAAITPTGFTIEGFTGGTFLGRIPESPQGWMFKSAVTRGVDISETPLDLTGDVTDLVITFTNRWSGLGGTVRDAIGNPDTTATVVVFPVSAAAWRNYGPSPRRLKSGATNAKGEFGISSLPQGDYYVVAISEDDAENWRDPKTLEALARIATTITIAEGEHRTIELSTKDVQR